MSCKKTQEFLAKNGIPTGVEVNARKTAIHRAEALRLAREADEIYVAAGKRVTRLDMKTGKPDDEALARLLLGPTGTLRAPTLKKGRALIVGFDEATYRELLPGRP